MAGSEATLGKTLGHGDWQTPGHSVLQQLHSQVSMIPISTTLLSDSNTPANTTSLCSLPLQHPLRLYDLHSHSTHYVLTIYIDTATITSIWSTVTAPITSVCSIWLQHLLRLSDLHRYSNYHVYMIYLVTATITSIWSILLQQISRPSDLICHNNYYVLWLILLQQLSWL